MLLGIWQTCWLGWPFLPTIFPTNGLLPLPPCLKGHCRRRLPSDMVLWLVDPFFRNEPISESLGASTSVPMMPCSRTGPVQARQRLGKQPLEWLFKQAPMWGAGTLS